MEPRMAPGDPSQNQARGDEASPETDPHPLRPTDMLHAFPRLATIALTIVAILIVVSQCRKPWSPVGRGFAWLMNRTHAAVTQWGLDHVTVGPGDTILDVGCGGGQTVRTLAGMGRMVHGVDYSPVSVAAAMKQNADLIADGRVQIRQAAVSQLPFPDGTFDMVTAVETHYFWPDPVNDFKEVLRVLKPGGTLLVIAETHKDQALGALMILPMLLVRARYLSVEEHREMLAAAGFTDIQIDRIPLKGWICAVGKRPVAQAA